jgi:hypothetical protein
MIRNKYQSNFFADKNHNILHLGDHIKWWSKRKGNFRSGFIRRFTKSKDHSYATVTLAGEDKETNIIIFRVDKAELVREIP